MSFHTHITQLVLTAMLLSGCATVTQTEKTLNKTDLEAKVKTFTCPDGSLVTTHEECIIYDPIIPTCYNSNGFILYKVNTQDSTDLTFESLNYDIEISLNQNDQRSQEAWKCEPTSVKIIGYADIIFGNEASMVSKRGADMVTDAVLAQGIPRNRILTEHKGAENPFLISKSPLLAEELNNRVELMVEFEVTP